MKEKKEEEMETPNNNIQSEKRKFRLYEHPWWSLLAVQVTIVVSIILAENLVRWMGLSLNLPVGQFTHGITFWILTIFIFVPFFLREVREQLYGAGPSASRSSRVPICVRLERV